MEKLLVKNGLIEKGTGIYDVNNISIIHHINQALKAHKIFKNETDYIIKDNQIVIIDEFTGRMQEGRRFSDGLHQALEAKEGVEIKNENQTLASITFQNYFRLYNKLAGMTGTASTEAVEFADIYKLKVVEIPTNIAVARNDEDDEIYKSEDEKNEAIVKAVKEAYDKKQPVLLGTVSIEKSEQLAKIFKKEKLPHTVLNAKYHEKEAAIIASAGAPGAITIATNMAGRGTDIKLGGNIDVLKEEAIAKIKNKEKLQIELEKIEEKISQDKEIVINAGGLFVLGTERHESRRIDNQLRGRSGRQGDVGRSKFYLSLEDDLMRIFGSEKLQFMLSKLGLQDGEAIYHPWITKTLAKAQSKVEARNYEIRKNLLKYDNVANTQRQKIFERRKELIESEDFDASIKKISEEINEDIVGKNIPTDSYPEQWDVANIAAEIERIYGLKMDIAKLAAKEGVSDFEILEKINEQTTALFKGRYEIYGEIEKKLHKQIFLITLDEEWKDHLLSLDKLRYGINLRAYAQKDPLIEYKREAFNLFEEMICQIEEKTISRIARAQIRLEDQNVNLVKKAQDEQKTFAGRVDPGFAAANSGQNSPTQNRGPVRNNIDSTQRDPNNPATWGNVGRNELCPCGSGKKYKHCHGRVTN